MKAIGKILICVILNCIAYMPAALSAELTNAVEIPIRFQRGRVIIKAMVNNGKEMTFLLDTGCTIPTLHPEAMDELKLDQWGSVRINGIAGEERAPTYRGLVLDLNGATYAPPRVAVVPSERSHSRRRDGVIGSGFLRKFVVEINPKRDVMRLSPPENFKYSGAGEVIPFHFREEIPVVSGAVVLKDRSIDGEFEIDTGCDSGVCLGDPFVQRNKLLETLDLKNGEKFGIGGKVETRSGTFPNLRLGKLEIPEPQTDFFIGSSPVDEPLAGHIGMGTLHRFKVIFDYPHKQLILEKP